MIKKCLVRGVSKREAEGTPYGTMALCFGVLSEGTFVAVV